jgi:ketosteroid isomerase-like protein
MSQADVAKLELVYADWARGDFTRTDVFAPDIEFVYSADFPDPAVFRGIDSMAEGWARWLREWRDVRMVAERFVDLDPLVIVDIVLSGTGKSSGAPLEVPAANLWTFQAGKAVRLEAFAGRESVRAAAGL